MDLLPISPPQVCSGVDKALAPEPFDATECCVDVRELCSDGWIWRTRQNLNMNLFNKLNLFIERIFFFETPRKLNPACAMGVDARFRGLYSSVLPMWRRITGP